jgi:beta-glucanase (GH16 family)
MHDHAYHDDPLTTTNEPFAMNPRIHRLTVHLFALALLTASGVQASEGWKADFFDDFDTFNHENWQDQLLWVNGEDQCYVREGQFDTREVSDGTLKLRVVDLGEPRVCFNWDKRGIQHPPTQYVAGRIASKNRKEFAGGRWTARLRVRNSGQPGMFPAWWLLGALNNEPPIEEPNENVCWPVTGSGEIDIFEHHSDGGPNHYAARAIKSLGYCDGGDWQSDMLVLAADLNEYHEYSVEWSGDDLVFRLDGEEVYRLSGEGANIPEPLFAILNFAKINDSPMKVGQWEMEVDWVKHEHRVK